MSSFTMDQWTLVDQEAIDAQEALERTRASLRQVTMDADFLTFVKSIIDHILWISSVMFPLKDLTTDTVEEIRKVTLELTDWISSIVQRTETKIEELKSNLKALPRLPRALTDPSDYLDLRYGIKTWQEAMTKVHSAIGTEANVFKELILLYDFAILHPYHDHDPPRELSERILLILARASRTLYTAHEAFKGLAHYEGQFRDTVTAALNLLRHVPLAQRMEYLEYQRAMGKEPRDSFELRSPSPDRVVAALEKREAETPTASSSSGVAPGDAAAAAEPEVVGGEEGVEAEEKEEEETGYYDPIFGLFDAFGL